MTSLVPVLQLLRILSFVGLALMGLLIVPAYHPRFSAGWRMIGVYFAAATVTVLLRMLTTDALSLVYNDAVLTPAAMLALVVLLVNVRRVSQVKP